MRYLFIFYYCLINAIIFGWNLDTYDDTGMNFLTNNTDYVVVHVSVFYIRAFLTLKSIHKNSTNQPITIIESTWPENLLPFKSRPFPNQLSHAKSACDCNGILQTVQTAVDHHNRLLWLLDNGSTYCPPKLIVFDLLQGNNEVHRHTFSNLKYNSLKSISLQMKNAIDIGSNDISETIASSLANYDAIILLRDQKHVLLYSMEDIYPKKLSFVIATKPSSSRKSNIYNVLIPFEMTMKANNEILISDRYNCLWLANLNQIQSVNRKHVKENIDFYVEVKYLGTLLGPAKSLAVPNSFDSAEKYLYYHLPRDGAILRWNFQRPLTAEGHDVLYFADASVAQILFGAKNSVWIAYEQNDEYDDHCKRILVPLNGGRLFLT